MKVLVTGAAGFIGAALVSELRARWPQAGVVAFDLVESDAGPATAIRIGDIGEPGVAAGLLDRETTHVFHLASLVSGGAEADFERGMRVNLDATRELLEAARRLGSAPTFVFASSIAVYGGELPEVITDDTPPLPQLSYGAHKLACEILINDYSRRGFVDGRSLRLPTVMVRPGAANTAVSGWASAIVREPLAGRDYDCPVGPDTSMACVSLARTVGAFLHAATLPASALGADRTTLLTGIPVTAREMAQSVQRLGAGRRLGTVRFAPDAKLQAIMDRLPRAVRSERAVRLGFEPSASIDEIVAGYLAGQAAPGRGDAPPPS
ncbi:MAG: NAD-dependent epimerase/dehydratase family protein [Burkholderiaceae bacterium]|nr:NAD-dependent epimerase/dehydratase family protein [Burkholderiaceae bacterium]